MVVRSFYHLVRVGCLGHVGRFTAQDAMVYRRGTRVLCRTPRGLEVGEVLNFVELGSDLTPTDGSLVRAMTATDELLQARLRKNREQAYGACRELLADRGLSATLIDVEQLFDGECIYFYFLGEISAEVQALVDQLGQAYEAKVQFRDFAAAVEMGCGPGCGTDEAAGCGADCGSCSVASACKLK